MDFDGPADSDIKTDVKIKGGPSDTFAFDKVFPMNTKQQDVFEFGIKETVDGA